MVAKSYLKCDISNKMDGTLIFFAKVLLNLRMWGTTMTVLIIITIIIIITPAKHDVFLDYDWARFFADDENDSDFEGF